jgi:transposase
MSEENRLRWEQSPGGGVGISQELELTADMELGKGEKIPYAKTVRTCQKLLNVEKAMWTVVYQEGVEPTNNSAKQSL